MGVRVKFEDKGLGALAAKIRTLQGLDLSVGVQGQAGRKVVTRGRDERGRFSAAGRVTVADVALFNEFGTDTIPARPFIRTGISSNRTKIRQVTGEAYGQFVAERPFSALHALTKIGEFIATKVKQRIDAASSWARPNAPSTVAKKGFDRPLHDTDRLSSSISWAVRGPGGSIISEGPAR